MTAAPAAAVSSLAVQKKSVGTHQGSGEKGSEEHPSETGGKKPLELPQPSEEEKPAATTAPSTVPAARQSEHSKKKHGPAPPELTKGQVEDAELKNFDAKIISAICYDLALLASALIALFGVYWSKPIMEAAGLAVALGTTFLFLAAVLVRIDWYYPTELLLRFLREKDWFPSLSRLQFFAWTALALVAFAWITLIRIFSGVPAFSGTFPPNLIGILTISAGSAVAANAIGKKVKPSEKIKKCKQLWGAILDEVTEDGQEMRPSLAKFQMLGWTVISIGIYVAIVWVEIYNVWIGGSPGSLSLPDLDPTLLVLMGISQSGYLGAKYVSTTSTKK